MLVRKSFCIVLLAACLVLSSSRSWAKVRFYTGNLSVGYFREYWGTGKAGPGDSATDEFCKQMKDASVTAACDYLAWCRIEPEPGKWDWSFYDKSEQTLHSNGLQYNIYAWLHFPPKWFTQSPDYVPYRCLEHNEVVEQTSIWAPGTLKAYDHFYKALAGHFGNKIDFIRLSMPAEYGEIGCPTGMTDWLVKQKHVHAGLWCGDQFARTDFKRDMKERYGSIGKLNKAWGTEFRSFTDVTYPLQSLVRCWRSEDLLRLSPSDRRSTLDFIGWYYDSNTEFARKAIGIVRKYFPNKEIIVSMGYGSQRTIFGNDDVGVARMCSQTKVACQTPGNVPYFVMKSLSTPCHFYNVPYFTEPPGDVKPDAEVNRIWSDASCGTQTYFDYPPNLLRNRDIMAKYADYLDGEQPVVDVAVFFPTTVHRLRNEDWPEQTITGANSLRDLLDYDLVDERMVQDGALSRYKILVMYEGSIVESSTLPQLRKWISDGGILIVRNFGSVETVEGDKSFFNDVFPHPKSLNGDCGALSISDLLRTNARQIGKGRVIIVPSQDGDEGKFAALASSLAFSLSKLFPGKQDVLSADGKADGVTATIFPTKILYLNPGDTMVEKTVRLNGLRHDLKLKPHSIEAVRLGN